ncbi:MULTISPECIES: hypothetical protein [unclassified Marinovum]|uniref:hypothetical protein n=1 Tax=unclassified Marinovum TaxID=2647166 RepID=UPI003EDC406A
MKECEFRVKHRDIPVEAFCGLPVRIEHKDIDCLVADWHFFKTNGFEVRDMRPRVDCRNMISRNGFTVQWVPRLKAPLHDEGCQ